MDVPQPAVNAVHKTSGFVYGAFGKDGPEERFNLCGPFWASALGLTIGLPIVLLFWGIRLVFGKGKAARIASFLDKAWVGKLLVILIIVVGIGGLVLLPLLVGLLENEWGVASAVWGGLLLSAIIVWIMDHLPAQKEKHSASDKTYRMICYESKTYLSLWEVFKTQIRELLGPIPVLLGLPFIALFNTMKLFAVMAHATYKRYCPIVEVSY